MAVFGMTNVQIFSIMLGLNFIDTNIDRYKIWTFPKSDGIYINKACNGRVDTLVRNIEVGGAEQ